MRISIMLQNHNWSAWLRCGGPAQALLEAPWPEQLLKHCSLPGLEGDKDPVMQMWALPLARWVRAHHMCRSQHLCVLSAL